MENFKELDFFTRHAAMVWRQEGCTVAEARFKAWLEGPSGFKKRCEAEQEYYDNLERDLDV